MYYPDSIPAKAFVALFLLMIAALIAHSFPSIISSFSTVAAFITTGVLAAFFIQLDNNRAPTNDDAIGFGLVVIVVFLTSLIFYAHFFCRVFVYLDIAALCVAYVLMSIIGDWLANLISNIFRMQPVCPKVTMKKILVHMVALGYVIFSVYGGFEFAFPEEIRLVLKSESVWDILFQEQFVELQGQVSATNAEFIMRSFLKLFPLAGACIVGTFLLEAIVEKME